MYNLIKGILPIYLFFTGVTLSFSQVKIDLEKRTMFSVKDTLEISFDLTELSKEFSDQTIFGNNPDDFEIRLIIQGEGRRVEFDPEGSVENDHFKFKQVDIDLRERLLESIGLDYLTLIQDDMNRYLFRYKSPSSMADLFNMSSPEYFQGLNIQVEYINTNLNGDDTGKKVTNSESILLSEGSEFDIRPFDQTLAPRHQLLYVSTPIRSNLNELIKEINSDLLYNDERFYQGSDPAFATAIDFDNDGKKELLARIYNYYLGYEYDRPLTDEEKKRLVSRIAIFQAEKVEDSLVYSLNWKYDEKSEGTNIYPIDLDNDGDTDFVTKPDVFHGTIFNRPSYYGDSFHRPNFIYRNNSGSIEVDSLNINVYPGSLMQVDQDIDLELVYGFKEDWDKDLELVVRQFEDGEFTEGDKYNLSRYLTESIGSVRNIDLNNDGEQDLLLFGSSTDYTGEPYLATTDDIRSYKLIAFYSKEGRISPSDETTVKVLHEFETPFMIGWEGDPLHFVVNQNETWIILNLIRNGSYYGERAGNTPSSILKAFRYDGDSLTDITAEIFPNGLDKSYFSLPNQPVVIDVNNDGLDDLCFSTTSWTMGANNNYSIPIMLNNGDNFEPRYLANFFDFSGISMSDIDSDGSIEGYVSLSNAHKYGLEQKWNNTYSWYNFVTNDKDLDGVVDSEDNAPDNYNPDQKDYDGDQIADVIDDDDDNDQVKDVNDECPNSALGVTVDAKGCEVFALPSNTFSVTVTSATCSDSSNGSITISSSNTDYSYRYAIDDQAPQALTDNTQTISNLSAGIYTVCITVDGVSGYERCYTIEITEPAPLVASSRIDMSSRNIELDLSGSKEYQVTLNGRTFLTSEDRLSLNLEPGMNRVEVATSLDCQGVYFEEIFVSEEVKVYPNPTSGKTQVYIAGIDQKVVLILRNLSGETIDKINYDIPKNRVINIDLSSIPQGMFLLDIKGNTVNQIEKVIKE